MEEEGSVIEEWTRIDWNARVFFQKLPIQSPLFHIREMACHLYLENKSHQGTSKEYFELILRGRSANPPKFVSFYSKTYILDMHRNIRFEEINVITRSEKSFEYCIWRVSKERILEHRYVIVGDSEWLYFVCIFGPLLENPSYKKIELELRKSFKKSNTVDILSSDYMKLFDQDPMKDVTIRCKNENILAHKIVLSARCKTFAVILQNDEVIDLSNMLSSEFRPILYYIYTGKLPEITLANMYVIYEASHAFQLDALKMGCANFMIGELSANNLLRCLNRAKKCNDTMTQLAIGAFVRFDKRLIGAARWRIIETQYLSITSWSLEDEKIHKILHKIFMEL